MPVQSEENHLDGTARIVWRLKQGLYSISAFPHSGDESMTTSSKKALMMKRESDMPLFFWRLILCLLTSFQ
jgi:hypothetical protein